MNKEGALMLLSMGVKCNSQYGGIKPDFEVKEPIANW